MEQNQEPREFILEINIIDTGSDGDINNWKNVKRLTEEVNQETLRMDVKALASQIQKALESYCRTSSDTKVADTPKPLGIQQS